MANRLAAQANAFQSKSHQLTQFQILLSQTQGTRRNRLTPLPAALLCSLKAAGSRRIPAVVLLQLKNECSIF
jgi:hypothetical protein